MKISKLYLKILLVFVAVLVVADIFAFLIIIADEMPPHRMRRFTDKMEMARNLIEQEIPNPPQGPTVFARDINPLISVLAKGNSAEIWVTDLKGRTLAKSFYDLAPDLKGKRKEAYQNESSGIRLFTIKNGDSHSVYITAEMRKQGGNPLLLHMYLSLHPHREEVWLLHGLLLMTLLSALFLIPVTRTITRPLHQLSEAADRLAEGDFSRRAPATGRDEVAMLARKFNSMAASLEQMVLSGRELTANLSHELRSPLARMRIALQIAMEKGEQGLDNGKYLDKIQCTIESMDVLIGHILELSKLDLREPPPRTDNVNAKALLLSLLDTYSPVVEQKKLQIAKLLEDTPRLRCHAPSISILLDNVLSNAMKYTQEGGAILLKLWSDTVMHIEICNEHPSLSDKDLADMFIPFHRLDKGKEAGTGLGLATASKLAAIHEGSITAAYASGSVRVQIDLPFTAAG